ncbi:MAG: response regulator [Lachnospiraceae bacterium]|nr:response regulator [Lachnospiraceae bacterium]
MRIKHILAVDDNRTNLNIVKDALKDKYRVTCVQSGPEALHFLEQNRKKVDLILLDLIMPHMTGLDVLEQLKKDEKLRTVPVVFLTSNRSVETEITCLENGAMDFIGKPFAPKTLRMRVGRILELEEYQHNLEEMVEEKARKIEKIQRNIVVNLANVIESRDNDSGHHVKRTGAYVEVIARGLKKEGIYADELTEDYIARLRNASALHDIGKIAIPDHILCKPGRLTQEEFEVIQTHCEMGGKLVRECLTGVDDNHYMDIAVDVAVYHHEKWDGTGYPAKLKRDKIPLAARIMAIADVFDALISKRCYKEPYSVEEAFRIIRESRGTHFDPMITDVFLLNRESIINIIQHFQEEEAAG